MNMSRLLPLFLITFIAIQLHGGERKKIVLSAPIPLNRSYSKQVLQKKEEIKDNQEQAQFDILLEKAKNQLKLITFPIQYSAQVAYYFDRFCTTLAKLKELKKAFPQSIASQSIDSIKYLEKQRKRIDAPLSLSHYFEVNKYILQVSLIFKNIDLKNKYIDEKEKIKNKLEVEYKIPSDVLHEIEYKANNQFITDKKEEFDKEFAQAEKQLNRMALPIQFTHDSCVRAIQFTMKIDTLKKLQSCLWDVFKIETESLDDFISLKNEINKTFLLRRYLTLYKEFISKKEKELTQIESDIEKIRLDLMDQYGITANDLDILWNLNEESLHQYNPYFSCNFYLYLDLITTRR